MKRLWLVSIPVLALVALFAVRSSPTLAGPACASSCSATTADQLYILPGLPATTYAAGASVYQQVAGQYCSDKTGGQIYVPAGAQPDTGLTCPAVAAGAATGTATGTAASATPAGTKAPAASASASPTATAHP